MDIHMHLCWNAVHVNNQMKSHIQAVKATSQQPPPSSWFSFLPPTHSKTFRHKSWCGMSAPKHLTYQNLNLLHKLFFFLTYIYTQTLLGTLQSSILKTQSDSKVPVANQSWLFLQDF